MSRRYQLTLTEEQCQELQGIRDHDRTPSMRMKAAGILKVAAGEQLQEVARHRLLKPVTPETVKRWCVRYLQGGAQALRVQAGRGRKPASFPRHLDLETATAEVQGIVHRSPYLYEQPRSRWTLAALRQVVPWMRSLSLSGVHGILERLEVSYKQGQVYVHSPDLLYNVKLARIEAAKRASREDPERIVFLYEDEHSFFRQPSVTRAYGSRGGASQRAPLYAGADAMRRVAGCLDIHTGAVVSMQRNHFAVPQMIKFFRYVEGHYPKAETIYIALDNWPVHFAPEVLQDLSQRHSRIHLLRLPTYAPWTNPIEKVWRLFKQEFEHLHPFSTRWKELRTTVDAWFEARRAPNPATLRAVGLAA